MKKRLNVISLLFLLLLFSYCGKEGKQQFEPQGSSVHAALAEIDSLMWRQPDSAFTLLLQFVGSPEADGLDTYNGHYCQLLISELLYKNDCEQTNRQDLQKAVTYFDSLTLTLNDTPTLKSLIAGADPLSLTRNDHIPFLTARAHYINGVGYNERDSLVEACAEYLKALETMEEHYEEQELVEKKAQFMTYIYNRLGDMFYKQFMIEPAIVCYKHSYGFSVISPISQYSISNALLRIGSQYDMKGEKDSANYYYSLALAEMPDTTNIYFRDIVSTKALLSYQLTHQAEVPLSRLKQMAVLARDDEERLTRYLLVGNIYYEEGLYDSALFYLEPVMENKENRYLQIQVANYLRTIYDSLGNREKAEECLHYLALRNEKGAENSALVSQLSEMFKAHMSQKQEKEAGAKRKLAVKKTLDVIVPIAVALALAIIVMAKLRSKKLLRQQQEEADRSIEAERQAHRMEQATMSGRLKRSNQEVRELKDQIKKMDDLTAKTEMAASFNEEPICRLIMERVHEGQFKSKIDCELYKTYALDKQQMLDLRMAADRHFSQFTLRLRKAYPKLTSIDIDYCCLYLLNLTYADISALMQRAYNTVVERDGKIQKIIGSEKPLPVLLMDIAQNPSSV